MQNAVELSGVSRQFGKLRAVDNVDLEIAEGEFFALLGPSGSGKTTTLRLIAGFERADAGSISLFGSLVNQVPPNRRPVNTVFQDYALFPHLSVIDNVAYGLRVRGVDKKTRHQEALQSLELVHLNDHGNRKPSELSGGQRQRVALARAIVGKPRVLLLDEPLGALDLKLRESMQTELKTLQQKLGITFVFVTHDQNEALSLADRIAVFNEGRIVQTGTPQAIYRRPESRFVADFVGSSNVLEPGLVKQLTGEQRWASLRPEDIKFSSVSQSDAGDAFVSPSSSFQVIDCSYMGGQTRLTLLGDGSTLFCIQPSQGDLPEVGEQVHLYWHRDDLHLMDESST